MPVQPIPDDDPQVSPYLCVSTHVEGVSPKGLERRATDAAR